VAPLESRVRHIQAGRCEEKLGVLPVSEPGVRFDLYPGEQAGLFAESALRWQRVEDLNDQLHLVA